MDRQDGARLLLLVHAHPDDESIGTGATMARYAADGAEVTLVTCTLGELGEVIPPELAYLADGDGDRLGRYRITELAAACAALGIRDHRFLGGPGRWRDSGMTGLPANDSPDCFWQADVAAAAAELAKVIREVRPQVLVTYDENGFYGHPDHIQAHRVASAAIGLAAAGGQAGRWQVAKFYATAMPQSVAEAGARPISCPTIRSPPRSTARPGWRPRPPRCGRTPRRSPWTGDRFALADGRWQPVLGREFYTLLAGAAEPAWR